MPVYNRAIKFSLIFVYIGYLTEEKVPRETCCSMHPDTLYFDLEATSICSFLLWLRMRAWCRNYNVIVLGIVLVHNLPVNNVLNCNDGFYRLID